MRVFGVGERLRRFWTHALHGLCGGGCLQPLFSEQVHLALDASSFPSVVNASLSCVFLCSFRNERRTIVVLFSAQVIYWLH